VEIEYGHYNLLTPVPKQEEFVSSGHRVIFEMDETIYQADIFPETDIQHLKKEGVEKSFEERNKIDNSVERILLDNTTPVAKSLLGGKRGDLVMEGDVRVVEIMLSPFLIRKAG